MKIAISRTAVLTLVLVCGPFAANAAPVLGGPDGHYYEVIVANGIDWGSANTAAMGSSHLGVPGHLATLTSQAENDFVDSLRQPLLGDNETAGGAYISTAKAEAWIGGFQTPGCSPEPGCGWTWVNGEGAIPGANPFVNWHGGEPNDSGNDEDQIVLGRYLDGTWNDSRVANENIGGYIIEYDTVAPVANNDPGNMANSGETIQIDVLANDMLFGQDVTSLNITSPSPNGGTAVVVACVAPATSAFCVNYTSRPGFGQQDSFKYTVNSGDLESNEATVTIDVDGSVSVTPSGDDIVVFGGGSNGVPLLATGEVAQNSAQSSVKCCTVRDSRVRLRTYRNGSKKITHRWRFFDLGKNMGTSLADADCANLPQPPRGDLLIAPHFSVHTEVEGSLDPNDYRFGVCVVETGVSWQGPMHLDVSSEQAVDYPVDCKRTGIENQPLTLGLTTFPEEYNAPLVRPVTVECDPRGVAKWSTWYFVPNAVHLPSLWPSKLYVLGRFLVLDLMLGAMDAEGAVETVFLNDVRTQVRSAWFSLIVPTTPSDAMAQLPTLDDATVAVLTPGPTSASYPGSGSFPNPKGEIASHLMAVRYAVCNELANVDMPTECRLRADVLALLPPLPSP